MMYSCCSCGPKAPEAFFAPRRKSAAATMTSAGSKTVRRAANEPPRRIDVHTHISPPAYRKLKNAASLGPANERRDRLYENWNPGVTLEQMDLSLIHI